MIRYCSIPACNTLIFMAPGTRRREPVCTAHAGQRPPEESDAERVERTRRLMGWEKPRAR